MSPAGLPGGGVGIPKDMYVLMWVLMVLVVACGADRLLEGEITLGLALVLLAETAGPAYAVLG